MPRLKLTKSAIDSLPTRAADVVYWDTGCPGFGVKVTPKGRKVFIVLFRTGGAGSKLRKYTIGHYGNGTLHQARNVLRPFGIRSATIIETNNPNSSRTKQRAPLAGGAKFPLRGPIRNASSRHKPDGQQASCVVAIANRWCVARWQ